MHETDSRHPARAEVQRAAPEIARLLDDQLPRRRRFEQGAILAELIRNVEAEGTHAVQTHGMGGLGKTTPPAAVVRRGSARHRCKHST